MSRRGTFFISISLKLCIIVSCVLIAGLGTITYSVSRLTGADLRREAENANWTMNRWQSAMFQYAIDGIYRRAALFIFSINGRGSSTAGMAALSAVRREIETSFFEINPGIAGVLFAENGSGQGGFYFNERFELQSPGVSREYLLNLIQKSETESTGAFAGVRAALRPLGDDFILFFFPVKATAV